MILVFLFLPGTWIIYGLSRYGMSFLENLPNEDRLALSFLAALVYLSTSLMRTWELWQRTQATQKSKESKADS